jgi:hypothetical protein
MPSALIGIFIPPSPSGDRRSWLAPQGQASTVAATSAAQTLKHSRHQKIRVSSVKPRTAINTEMATIRTNSRNWIDVARSITRPPQYGHPSGFGPTHGTDARLDRPARHERSALGNQMISAPRSVIIAPSGAPSMCLPGEVVMHGAGLAARVANR